VNPLKRVAQALGRSIGAGMAAAMPPSGPDRPNKIIETIVINAGARRAKPDLLADVLADHVQNFARNGISDFREEEIADDSPRVTSDWDHHHYWTFQKVVEEYLSQGRLQDLMHIIRDEHGTTKRWKIIRDKKNRDRNVIAPAGGFTKAQLVGDNMAWRKGFLVELVPGDPGYDDTDTLRIEAPFKRRDFHNWLQRFTGDRQWGSVIGPGLDMASPVKTDNFGSNNLGSPSTCPEIPGELDAALVLCDPVAKSIDTLYKAVVQARDGAQASMKDFRTAVTKGDLTTKGTTIMAMLEDRANRDIPSDPGDESTLQHRRLSSALRFFGIDEEPWTENVPDDPDAPDLDQSLQLRIKLAGVLREIGRGHETRGHWGNFPLTEMVVSYRLQRDANGQVVYDPSGDPIRVREPRERLAITRHAFLKLQFYELAQWIIAAQKTSLEEVKEKILGTFQEGRKNKYGFGDVTLLTLLGGVVTLLTAVLTFKLDLAAGLILAAGAFLLVGGLTRVDDPEHMTIGEEKRTAYALIIIGLIAIAATFVHTNVQEKDAAANWQTSQQRVVDKGLITQEELDKIAQIDAQIKASHEQDNQQTAARDLWQRSVFSVENVIKIVSVGALIAFLLLVHSILTRRRYNPLQARHARWRRPLI